MADGAIIVGATQGIGLELAKLMAARGDRVTITGRDAERTRSIAKSIGANVDGLAVDLTKPKEIAPALAGVGEIRHVVIAAIQRDMNSVRAYDIDRAINLVTLKLVGYTEVVHALLPNLTTEASIVLFGGLAKERPYPGSTTVTSINGAVATMVRTMALELAPTRVNAIHPGLVGDSPAWAGKQALLDPAIARTPTKRLATMRDCADAVLFLLENQAVNGVNLYVDGGWVLT